MKKRNLVRDLNYSSYPQGNGECKLLLNVGSARSSQTSTLFTVKVHQIYMSTMTIEKIAVKFETSWQIILGCSRIPIKISQISVIHNSNLLAFFWGDVGIIIVDRKNNYRIITEQMKRALIQNHQSLSQSAQMKCNRMFGHKVIDLRRVLLIQQILILRIMICNSYQYDNIYLNQPYQYQMTLIQHAVMMMIIYLKQNLVDAVISPLIISLPNIQSGSWTNCLQNCATFLGTQYTGNGYYSLIIQFNPVFTEIPQMGVSLTSLNDYKLGNNIFGYPLNIFLTNFTLFIGYFNQSLPITVSSLGFTWIATTSPKIFMITQVYSNGSSFSYPSYLNPLDNSNIQQFLFIRGGYNLQGCNATSSLDITNSQVVIDFKGWIAVKSSPSNPDMDFGITIIVVNTEKSSDQRSYTRALSGVTQQTNQKIWDINTIPVLAGQQQNMVIGLSQYYNPNSIWTFALTIKQQNTSLIEYQFNFDSSSILTLQYLQLEILNCTVTNSIFNQDICVCINGYYENQSNCQQCSNLCATCSAIDQCQLCETVPNLSLQNGYCICNTGYVLVQSICQACDSTCYQCSGVNNNQCTTCNQISLHRILSSTSSCICQLGYFQATPLCQACTYSCQTCSSSSTCDTCDKKVMIRYFSFSQCSCLDGYYDTMSQPICSSKIKCQKYLECDFTCQTCLTSAINCQSCSIINYRSILTNTCPCVDGYYQQINQALCQACYFSCLTCVTQANNCLSCNTTNYRNIMTNTCPCVDGYYELFNQPICQSCDNTCLTCLTTANNCQSCNTTNHRSILKLSDTCPCVDGYYQQVNQALCLACYFSCQTCVTQANNCLSCNTTNHRSIMTNNTCPCVDGYYELTNYPICQNCDLTCLTCTRASNNCQTCNTINHRSISTNTCLCMDGYYEIVNQPICQNCDITCLTCLTTVKNCQSCNTTNHRILLTNACPCSDGYYQQINQALCYACNFTCLTCLTTANNCQSCNTTNHRSVLTLSDTCPCVDGYYQQVNQALCQACYFSCQTCVTQANNCLSCNTTNHRSIMTNNTCPCIDGYYEVANQPICQHCDITCLTCMYSPTDCQSCNIIDNRSLINNTCPCVDGYYEQVNQTICQQCDIICSTCIYLATYCLSCNITNNRILQNNTCSCVDGYYEQSSQAICQQCDITCLTCISSPTNCQSCNNTNLRSLTRNSCSCIEGHYEQENQVICQKCYQTCLKCDGPGNNQCTGCQSDRYLFNAHCLCTKDYYQDSYSVCQGQIIRISKECHYTCQECTGPDENQCKICGGDKSTNRFKKSSKCVCEDGYYSTLNVSNCKQCHPRCKTCFGGMKNSCLTCFNEHFRQIIGSECVCSNGYFQSNNQQQCLTCVSDCLICPNKNDTQSIYQDIDCVCDMSCVNHQYTIQLLEKNYDKTKNKNAIGIITGLMEPLGFLSVIFRTRQMVLTTLVLENQKVKTVFMLQRMLSLFIFKATLSPDQTQGNLTFIKCFYYMDVTKKSMIYQYNPYLRLLGFSELIIYNSLPQLSILGIFLILFLSLKCINIGFKRHEQKTQKLHFILIALVHINIEGSLLILFTQIFMNFKALATDRPIHLQGIDFIASFIVSLFIFTFYLGFLIKAFLEIDNHMKKKIFLFDGESQQNEFQLESEQLIKVYKFYLESNPMKTRPQAVFTVMSQFKKIMFCVIIVLGQGQIEVQLLLFFLLGTVFLIYALITAPKKNKMQMMYLVINRIGIFDLVIQIIFLVYIISSFIDFEETQKQSNDIHQGELTFTLIIIILSLDLSKIIYQIVSAISIWRREKKIKKQKVYFNDASHDQSKFTHDVCQDYISSLRNQKIPSDLNVMPLDINFNQQRFTFKHPRSSEIWIPSNKQMIKN